MSIPENKHTSSASVLDLVTTFCFVDLQWDQFSQWLDHLSHARYMIPEIVGKSNELQKILLRFGKRELKHL